MALLWGLVSGDSVDTGSANAATEVSLAEPTAGLVSRLLTGLAETTYTWCTCGTVSRPVDRVTGLHPALPKSVTWTGTGEDSSSASQARCSTLSRHRPLRGTPRPGLRVAGVPGGEDRGVGTGGGGQ